ncbi:hypothetical protein [Sphingobacterium rhinopitheci]|uniref:hypothetical protein n=1 Tax=Sphingobacterium rhinopitheci TaxID=2781960 RepID=UPI001F51C777|nr:hypothetical protein [Sphingobacterium rhinopitheci]MCI0921935.1 hypothetical protein [Sphingobacterium rhinopitheci]
MKEVNQFNFSIENISKAQLLENPQIIADDLNKMPKNTFKDYLLDRITNKDGAPTFSNLKTTNFHIDGENDKGKFRITFEIDRTYCCSDTQSSNVDYADFDFELINNKLNATTNYFVWDIDN